MKLLLTNGKWDLPLQFVSLYNYRAFKHAMPIIQEMCGWSANFKWIWFHSYLSQKSHSLTFIKLSVPSFSTSFYCHFKFRFTRPANYICYCTNNEKIIKEVKGHRLAQEEVGGVVTGNPLIYMLYLLEFKMSFPPVSTGGREEPLSWIYLQNEVEGRQ